MELIDSWKIAELVRVLHCVAFALLKQRYHVLRFNSRGVGRSTGWSSLTGASEGRDLHALVQWGLENVANVRSVVIVVSSSGPPLCCVFANLANYTDPGLLAWRPNCLSAPCPSRSYRNFSYPSLLPFESTGPSDTLPHQPICFIFEQPCPESSIEHPHHIRNQGRFHKCSQL